MKEVERNVTLLAKKTSVKALISKARPFEQLAFMHDRVASLMTGTPGIRAEDLEATILPEMQKIAEAVAELSDPALYNHHVDLDAIIQAQPRSLSTRERRGWKPEAKSNPVIRRKQLIRSIVWRSCAVHFELGLHELANRTLLRQLIDRRLHAVEMMRYHVSAASLRRRAWTHDITSGLPKWTDRHVLRMFEYPRVPNTPNFRAAVEEMLEANLATTFGVQERARWPVTRIAPGQYNWTSTSENLTREWYLSLGGGWYRPVADTKLAAKALGQAVAAETGTGTKLWERHATNDYRWILTVAGRSDPGAAIEAIFRPSQPTSVDATYDRSAPDLGWRNWWTRNHLYCDQVVHCLALKALLVSLRSTPQGTAPLNALLQNRGGEYVQVYFPWGEGPYLGRDPIDPYFENLPALAVADLQIGDAIRVDNHPAYDHLTNDVWRNENALVMDIVGRSLPRDILVQGHGTGVVRLRGLLKLIIAKFEEHLRGAQALVRSKASTASGGLLSYGDRKNNIAVMPGRTYTDKTAWAVRWQKSDSPELTPEARTSFGIVEDPAERDAYFFPLFTRDSHGRLQDVIVSRLIMPAHKYFARSSSEVEVMRPRVIWGTP